MLAVARGLPAQAPRGVQPEGRLEVVAGEGTAVVAGAGVNVPAGWYARLGVGVAVGAVRVDAAAHRLLRVDATARFLLDPFRERAVGWYGLAGLGVLSDAHNGTRPRLLAGVGMEAPMRGRRLVAAEVAIGGGVRAAVVVRRARRSGR